MKANVRKRINDPIRTPEAKYIENQAITEYKLRMLSMLKYNFPRLSEIELARAIDWSISNHFKDSEVEIHNNYKNKTVNMKLSDYTEYIYNNQPILMSSGLLVSQHGVAPNPIKKMLQKFAASRKAEKAIMFQYSKGSEEFAKHNLLQLLHKLDSNAYYGASGRYSCIYYNLYVATGVTREGKFCNSTAALFFERFLNNNVPVSSLNELIDFIYNVLNENREFNSAEIITKHANVTDTFFQIMSLAGFGWIPTEDEMFDIWEIITKLNQDQLDRLFYKNNLFAFIENPQVQQAIIYILQTLEAPFLNPNKPPKEIEEPLNVLYRLLFEFVYYKGQMIDKVDKMQSLMRSVSIIQDTDSAIVSFDGWYQRILNMVFNVPLRIKNLEVDEPELAESGRIIASEPKQIITEYSFLDEDVIEVDREINPTKIIPQDGLRYSIINILAYCVGNMANDFMYRFCNNNNSNQADQPCLISLKNEFLFKRLLMTEGKKMYASIVELQEGNIIPTEEQLDVKGIPALVKSSSNPAIQKRLKEILYEDILNADEIDQVKVLKDIARVEKEIFDSINRGEKKFYKPLVVKAISSYANPMSMQGITASYAYNQLRDPDAEMLDLNSRNSVDIAKVDINKKNIDKIIESHPDVYQRAVKLLQTPEYSGGITSVAIPVNEPVPDWILPFINYAEIIQNNISGFPIESIGLYRGCDDNNSMNIIQF